MYKFMILLILTVLLTGCSPAYIFNLDDFVTPNDTDFILTVERLDTPYKICDYMKENFTPVEYHEEAYSPYEMWCIGEGDCNDFCCFALFCATYHGYEVYQMYLVFEDFAHVIAVYKVEEGYLVSDLNFIHTDIYTSFKDIAGIYNGCIKYTVYSYAMDIIEVSVL